MGFIEDLFNETKVRYTVYEEMCSDIMKVARLRAATILSTLDSTSQFSTVSSLSPLPIYQCSFCFQLNAL